MKNEPKFAVGDKVNLKYAPYTLSVVQKITTYKDGIFNRIEYQTEFGHGIPEEDIEHAS